MCTYICLTIAKKRHMYISIQFEDSQGTRQKRQVTYCCGPHDATGSCQFTSELTSDAQVLINCANATLVSELCPCMHHSSWQRAVVSL